MFKRYSLELILAIMVVLAPIKAVMITVGILVVADLIMGIWAAKKRGEEITSARMSHSVVKTLVYQSAVITGFLVEKYLMDGALPVCKIIAGLIGSVELKSLLESGQDILGQPVFRTLVEQLKPKLDPNKDYFSSSTSSTSSESTPTSKTTTTTSTNTNSSQDKS